MYFDNGGGALNNAGTLRKSSGTGTANVHGSIAVNNIGLIEAQSGTLGIGQLNNNGTTRALANTVLSITGGTSTGMFDIVAGSAILNLNGGTFDATASFTGIGVTQLSGNFCGVLSGGNFVLNNSLGGAVTIAGTLNWTAGYLGRYYGGDVITIAQGSVLNITGSDYKAISGGTVLNNSGTIRVADGAAIRFNRYSKSGDPRQLGWRLN